MFYIEQFKKWLKKKKLAWAVRLLASEGWTPVRLEVIAGTHYLVRRDGAKYALKNVK